MFIGSKFLPRFPWLCSLKGPGFTGRHRCGVTLLSGGNVKLPGSGKEIFKTTASTMREVA